MKVRVIMEAAQLVSLLAKAAGVDELHVEELGPDWIKPPAPPKQLAAPPKQLAKPKMKRAARRGYAINIEAGLNGAMMTVLADGQPHRYAELGDAAQAAGYSRNGIGNKLSRLAEHGFVHQPGFGMWQIGEAKKKTA